MIKISRCMEKMLTLVMEFIKELMDLKTRVSYLLPIQLIIRGYFTPKVDLINKEGRRE